MSEHPGNGYARVEVTFPTVEGSWDALTSYSVRPPDPDSWGTFTYAVIYDGEVGSPRTALDYVRASNRWPKPYSTVLWAGTLS